MGFFKNMFTWWEGAGLGTTLFSWRNGVEFGRDTMGNIYFHSKRGDRRWVMYSGANDASRIPPEWHGWLHHQYDGHPDQALPPVPKFLKHPTANLTGSAEAYRPSGTLERGGQRQAASGDYEAWTPR